MSENTVRIIGKFEPFVKKPKVMPWHWLAYFIFNLYRKPLVWKKQKELLKILVEVQSAMEEDLYPALLANQKTGCYECRDIYFALKSQTYLSTIEKLLDNLSCYSHTGGQFKHFLEYHREKFIKSEEIARWVNNL